jgi:hypothetical protein
MKYENAWNCKDCPERADEAGCPCWWEFAVTPIGGGDIYIQKGCGMTLLPQMVIQNCKAAEMNTAEMNQVRAVQMELVETNKRLSNVFEGMLMMAGETPPESNQLAKETPAISLARR